MFNVTRGYAALETINAVESAIASAEKSGDLNQLVNLVTSKGSTLFVSGDLVGSNLILDRALELADRQDSSSNLAYVHAQQTIVRYWRGDHRGAEEHFKVWLALFNDRDPKQPAPGRALNVAVNALAFGSYNAWFLGQPNVVRAKHR